MANKNNKSSKKAVKTYTDLLYMTSSEITAKDIAALLKNTQGVTVQHWEEMNVVELELPNEDSVDFEPLPVHFKDPSDAAFVRNRNIKTIFTINLCEEDLTSLTPVFEMLIENYGGFVCADTVDFNPVYAGSSKLVKD